jgi:pimeloyl-ACP methyl ester carboxylesterase
MRILRRFLKGLGLTVLAAVLAGGIYQQIGTRIDARALPPPGRMVVVDGRRIHVLCTGAGERTLVLDSGLAGWSTMWYRVQPALAEHWRVCSLDRPGLGWSEAGGDAFDAAAAAAELSRIADAARIARPFVYVGHSLGANFAQVYAALRPREVEALVLIEPGDPKDLLEDFHGSRQQAMALPACSARCVASKIAGNLGIMRLLAHAIGAKSFAGDAPALARYRAGIARSSLAGTAAAYLDALPKTAFQCLDVRSFGALPVLTLATSAPRQPEGKETVQDVIAWRQVYLRHLAALAAKSSRGEGPIVIPDSTHASVVLQEKPAAATVRAIEAFLARLPPPPAGATAGGPRTAQSAPPRWDDPRLMKP